MKAWYRYICNCHLSWLFPQPFLFIVPLWRSALLRAQIWSVKEMELPHSKICAFIFLPHQWTPDIWSEWRISLYSGNGLYIHNRWLCLCVSACVACVCMWAWVLVRLWVGSCRCLCVCVNRGLVGGEYKPSAYMPVANPPYSWLWSSTPLKRAPRWREGTQQKWSERRGEEKNKCNKWEKPEGEAQRQGR